MEAVLPVHQDHDLFLKLFGWKRLRDVGRYVMRHGFLHRRLSRERRDHEERQCGMSAPNLLQQVDA